MTNPKRKRSKDKTQYIRLWAELEMPKLLKQKERKE
jgi:ribosomal protein L32